jgi:hypothetical protein
MQLRQSVQWLGNRLDVREIGMDSIPGGSKDFPLALSALACFREPHSLLSDPYQCYFCGVKRPGREEDLQCVWLLNGTEF